MCCLIHRSLIFPLAHPLNTDGRICRNSSSQLEWSSSPVVFRKGSGSQGGAGLRGSRPRLSATRRVVLERPRRPQTKSKPDLPGGPRVRRLGIWRGMCRVVAKGRRSQRGSALPRAHLAVPSPTQAFHLFPPGKTLQAAEQPSHACLGCR